MNSDADKLWEDIASKFRKHNGLCSMTPEEAIAAFHTAPHMPLSAEQIRRIVKNVVTNTPPEMEIHEPEWCEDREFADLDAELQHLHHNEGDYTDPEAEEAERKLREQMLNDDEDGMEGETTPP